MYPDAKQLQIQRKNYKLEDPFNYKLLITHKNFFNSVKLCKTPPVVSYSYTDIANLCSHLFKCYISCRYPEHPKQPFNLQRVTSMTPAQLSSNGKITEINLPRCTVPSNRNPPIQLSLI